MVNSSTQFYKLATTPRGRQLWIYMAAILEVTEMDQGKSFPLKRFLGNFQTHLAAGRIERVPEGFSSGPSLIGTMAPLPGWLWL